MTRYAFGLVVVLLLAGCVGAPSDVSSPTPTDVDEPSLDVSDTQGAIGGVVLDDSLKPLADAAVTLSRPSSPQQILASRTTDMNGTFLFSLLDPGAYLLSAAAEGRTPRTAVAEVIAEEIATVRISLTETPGVEPYVVLTVQNGIIHCVASALVWPGEPYADAVCGESTYIQSYPVPDGWQALVGETNWNSIGDSMLTWYIHQNETTGAAGLIAGLAEGIGQAPVRVVLLPGVLGPEASRAAPAGSVWVASPETGFTLEVRNYYTGILQEELNQTFSAQCYGLFGFTCFGVGASAEFRYGQYITAFINGRPSDLDAYSALPDA